MPQGQLRLDNLLVSIPDRIAKPETRDVFEGTNTLGTRSTAAGDAREEIQRGCRMAHFGVFTDRLTPFQRGTAEWVQELNEIVLDLSPHTTILDGEDWKLGGWGWLADLRNPSSEQTLGAPFRTFASHVLVPGGATAPAICHEGRQHPFGVESVLGFTAAAHIGNPPPSSSGVAPRQQVVFAPGSSAVLTIKGVGARTLSLKGAVEIELSACGATSCTAELSNFDLYTSPFSLEGHDVSLLRLSSGGGATGVLQGTTLAFTQFTGSVYAQLTNGKYDQFPVRTGVLLARWDPAANAFVMAFSVFGKTAEGDEVSFDGTAMGAFANTSPSVTATVKNPPTPIVQGKATIECESPSGADVELRASGTDREDGAAVRFSWFHEGNYMSQEAEQALELSAGSHDVQVMAYDARGFAASDELTIDVVDTVGPVIDAKSVCIFPPNHRQALIRITEELAATAIDRCDGGSAALKIVDVRSTGGGVIRWSEDEACVSVERTGDETAREYEIDLAATDATGNRTVSTARVTIPHNGPPTGCLRTKNTTPCE